MLLPWRMLTQNRNVPNHRRLTLVLCFIEGGAMNAMAECGSRSHFSIDQIVQGLINAASKTWTSAAAQGLWNDSQGFVPLCFVVMLRR